MISQTLHWLPACRRLLFPLFPRATKEIGDVCTQAILTPGRAKMFSMHLITGIHEKQRNNKDHNTLCNGQCTNKEFKSLTHMTTEKIFKKNFLIMKMFLQKMKSKSLTGTNSKKITC